MKPSGWQALRWVFLALLGLFCCAVVPVRVGSTQGVEAERSTGQLYMETESGSGATTFYTTTITIPTYPYADHLYDAYSATYNMTYPKLDWDSYNASNPTPTLQDYELLVMENDYLVVTVLPELGGRVYQLIDKATGENHLYQNPVIKPTHWGPPEQGWWLAAGGIEWCLPVDEHGYEWGLPWDWTAVVAGDGVTITVSDTGATDRLRARIDLFLPAERAYLAVTPHIENPTAAPIDYKFWNNAMLAPGNTNKPAAGLEFIFNAPEMAVHSTGDARLPGAWPTVPAGPDYRFTWPYHYEVNYSRLGNWREWLGFFEYPQAAADFVGLYNHENEAGVARIFPSNIARGAKGFAYGWAAPLDWHIWTDVESAGVELHGGVAPTFWDTAHLGVGETLAWTEVWYPVNGTGGITSATREAALHFPSACCVLSISLHTTAPRAAEEGYLVVWDRGSCGEMWHETLPALTPDAPYHTGKLLGTFLLDDLTVAYVDKEGNVLVAFGPTTCLDAGPQLALETPHRVLLAEAGVPQVLTTSVRIDNVGYGVLTWSAEVVPEGTLALDLPVPYGMEGERLWIVVDSAGYETGVYTGAITVTAHQINTLNSPQRIDVMLRVAPELIRVYLPAVLRNYTPPQTINLP